MWINSTLQKHENNTKLFTAGYLNALLAPPKNLINDFAS